MLGQSEESCSVWKSSFAHASFIIIDLRQRADISKVVIVVARFWDDMRVWNANKHIRVIVTDSE